jgi:hypothetical protein
VVPTLLLLEQRRHHDHIAMPQKKVIGGSFAPYVCFLLVG